MKTVKTILFFGILVFTFSSCNTCKECKHSDLERSLGWEGETHGALIEEVCSDNFESKADFKSYIEEMEQVGYECKSDFLH